VVLEAQVRCGFVTWSESREVHVPTWAMTGRVAVLGKRRKGANKERAHCGSPEIVGRPYWEVWTCTEGSSQLWIAGGNKRNCDGLP
jgi:hypothetical protein